MSIIDKWFGLKTGAEQEKKRLQTLLFRLEKKASRRPLTRNESAELDVTRRDLAGMQ